MPIGITEEHEELRQAVRRFVDDAHPARGRCARRSTRERETRPDVLGRARASRAGSACTSPRRTAARATGSSSRRSCSRSSAARARPARTSRPRSSAAVLAGRRRPGGRRAAARGSRSGELTGAVALERRATGARRRTSPTSIVVRGRRRVVRARRAHAVGATEVHEHRPRPAASRRIDLDARSVRRRSPAREPRRANACATSRRCCSRPRRSASRSGASTPRPSTRRCACSSAGRSASSRA